MYAISNSRFNYLPSIASLTMRIQCLLAILAVSTGLIPRLSKAEDTDNTEGNQHASFIKLYHRFSERSLEN